MASALVAEEVVGDMLMENETAGDTQEENIQSEFFGANRYNSFQPRVGNPHVNNNEWETQKRKRKRRDTNSVDAEAFSQMETDEKLLVLFKKLSLVEGKQNSLNAVLSPVYEKIDVLENCVNIHAKQVKMLSYRSLDQEARCRRNNLVFRGLADIHSEDCKMIIAAFLQDELKLDISVQDIARAHRLGSLARARARYAVTRRPIIVNFKDYSSTEIIMESAKLLRGTMFRVEKDFPAEISEARRRLWPTFKSEKEKHPTARVIMGYPAKVIRSGRVVRDEFPDWNDILRVSRVRGFESDESSGDEGDTTGYRDHTARQSRPPFRPWQRPNGPELDGSMYHTADTDTGSDTSAMPKQHKKEYSKGKQPEYPSRHSSKMTERVADNMRNSKSNKGINNLPTVVPSYPSLFQKNTTKQNKRSSSVPDTTRGRTKINTEQRSDEPIRPINKQQTRDSTLAGNVKVNDVGGVAENSQ